MMILSRRILKTAAFLILVPATIVSCGGAQPGGESVELKTPATSSQESMVPQGTLVTCGEFKIDIAIKPKAGFLEKRKFVANFKAPTKWGTPITSQTPKHAAFMNEFDYQPTHKYFKIISEETKRKVGASSETEPGHYEITYSGAVSSVTTTGTTYSSPQRTSIYWQPSGRT
jgi:hypothetical protein